MTDRNSGSPPDLDDADARVRFAMSEDGLTLGISRYFPPSGAGNELTAEAIRAQLREAGVTMDPEPGACDKIIRYLNEGREITKTALVRGRPAVDAQDASLTPEGDVSFPVFPGQVCYRLSPAVNAAEGLTIDGRVLKPRKTGKPKQIKAKAGDNCVYDAGAGTLTAEVYGQAGIKDGLVSVRPLLYVTEDETALMATIHWRDNLGRKIELDLFESEFQRLGVHLEPDEEALDKAVAQAEKTKEPTPEVVLVQGKKPVPGKDGWIEFVVEMPQAAGTMDEQGRMDWRNKGTHPSIQPGDTIGRVHPPEPGQGGIDIHGKSIPPDEGRPLTVTPGENVEQVGGDLFRATGPGMVVYQRKVLSVSDCLVVKDVDVSSGNIKVDTGSIRINGSVQTGFEVISPNHVVVGDTVENARIMAGGDVEVKNGVLMGEEGGLIRARGMVQAGFATGARIECGGDVILAGEASHCHIKTKGMLLVTGTKGVLQGGEVVAVKGVEVRELGSDLGVMTTVIIPWDGEEDPDLAAKKAEIVEKLNKLNEILGPGEDEDILMAANTEEQHKIGRMVDMRVNLRGSLESVNAKLAREAARRRDAIRRARVKVHGTIQPGVVLRIAGKVKEFTKTMDRSMFYYDPDKRELITTGF